LSVVNVAPAPDAKNSIESADASSLRSFPPAISMMKAAKPGTGHHRRGRRRLAVHLSSIRRVLIEGIVNPVVVIVVHVIANEPPQMLFVQRDDVVENLAATATDPAFRTPFCQGACTLARFGSKPVAFRVLLQTSW
jgi:hypothetical protein